jgi:transcriptional regulator with XRE-family HTH domain
MATLAKIKRIQLDISQQALAKQCSLPQCRISVLERGLVEPSPEEAEVLAQALNLSPGDLLLRSNSIKLEIVR